MDTELEHSAQQNQNQNPKSAQNIQQPIQQKVEVQQKGDQKVEQQKHPEYQIQKIRHKQSQDNISTNKQHQQKEIVILTGNDFKEWADNTPLEVPCEESRYGIKIGITQALTKGSGLTQYTMYNIVGQDTSGTFDVMRRYSQFNFLRKKLNERWPGVFIPAIPTKQILHKNDTQVTKNRQRFLNQFLHKLANLPHIYQSGQVQLFLKGEGSDVTKQLDKFKQLPAKELLRKYQEAFPQYVERQDSLKERSQIDQFQKFIKSTEQLLQSLKSRSRELAQSRDKYNSLAPKVFTNILSQYQANTIIQFSQGSESGSIFKSPQFPQLQFQLFQSSTKNNPFWLIYDLLKFQQRQTKGMKQTINELDELRSRRQQTIRKIQINKDEIKQLSEGKTTLRSLITPGTKQQIQVKLKAQNQQLQLLQEDLLKILNIATIQLDDQINQLKINKFKFYYRVIKKVYSVQMHNIEGAIDYCHKLEEITDRFRD